MATKVKLVEIMSYPNLQDLFQAFNPEPATTAAARWDRWSARFDNYQIARDIKNDARKKALLLHFAGEDVFDINETKTHEAEETCELLKSALTKHFSSKRNVEYEFFLFRQSSQNAKETLDQFHIRLLQLAKNCDFHDKSREIKSQIIQRCL